MANRVLRRYLSVENPSDEDIILEISILELYMFVWFTIPKSKFFTDCPKHVFEVIKATRFLPENLLQIINPVIERNTVFAHPENLLLSMIVDERAHTESDRRIMKARNLASRILLIRRLPSQKLDFQANEYPEMIDWTKNTRSAQSLLRNMSNQEMWAKIGIFQTS
nr:unnamed protein product [Callosobruchus chinensis]